VTLLTKTNANKMVVNVPFWQFDIPLSLSLSLSYLFWVVLCEAEMFRFQFVFFWKKFERFLDFPLFRNPSDTISPQIRTQGFGFTHSLCSKFGRVFITYFFSL